MHEENQNAAYKEICWRIKDSHKQLMSTLDLLFSVIQYWSFQTEIALSLFWFEILFNDGLFQNVSQKWIRNT